MTPRQKCLAAAVILVLVLLGLAARLPGIKWGLPYFYHVDERGFGRFTVGYFRGDLNPHFFEVPSLYTYMTAALWGGYYLGGRLAGRFDRPADIVDAYARDPTVFVVLGRLLSVLAAVGTVILVFLIGRRVYGLRAGALAGLLLVFSLEHVKLSHYFIPDVTMVFFLMLSFLFIWSIYTTGKTWAYVLAGLFAGLAYATKYGGHFLALPLVLAHLFRAREQGRPLLRSLLSPRFLAALPAFFGGFLIGTPFAVLDWPKFIHDFRWQAKHLFSVGHYGSSTAEPAWLFYVKYGFRDNIGRLAQFLVPAGVVLALVRHRRKDWLLLSVPLALFPMMGVMKTYATRYLMPLTCFFILLAALFLDELLGWLSTLLSRIKRPAVPAWLRTAVLGLVVLILVLPSAVAVVRYDDSVTRTDTRSKAKSWVEANIAKGERVAEELYGPPLNPKDYRFIHRNSLGEKDLDWLAARQVRYIIVSDIMYSRFTDYPEEFPRQAAFYRSLDEKAYLLKTFVPRWNEDLIDLHNPTIKVYGLSELPNYGFPGAFRRYAQDVRITAGPSGSWTVRSAVEAAEPRESREKLGRAYVRLRALDGRELWTAPLSAEPLPARPELRVEAEALCPALLEPFRVVIGYVSAFPPGLQSGAGSTAMDKETLLAGPVDPEDVRGRGFEGRYYYGEFPDTRGDLYFQSASLVRERSGWTLSGTAFGSRLRWGACYVLNPFVRITDGSGREVGRLVLSAGKVGGMAEAVPGPVTARTVIPGLPDRFKVFIGYDSFFSRNRPEAAGGPVEIEISNPKPETGN